MKNSIGMIPALVFVMFFIILISGYLAFNINYSKAFKVKSKIIDIVQKYDNDMNKKEIYKELDSYIKEVGYSASSIHTRKCVSDNYTPVSNQGWCYKIEDAGIGHDNSDDGGINRIYIKIRTFVSVDIPILNKILPNIRFFQLDGSTRTIKKISG